MNRYSLIDARKPIQGDPIDCRQYVYPDGSEGVNVGKPIKELGIWDKEVAERYHKDFSSFQMTLEEARTVASSYAKQMVENERRVATVKHIYRVMVPVVKVFSVSHFSYKWEMTAIMPEKPIRIGVGQYGMATDEELDDMLSKRLSP